MSKGRLPTQQSAVAMVCEGCGATGPLAVVDGDETDARESAAYKAETTGWVLRHSQCAGGRGRFRIEEPEKPEGLCKAKCGG